MSLIPSFFGGRRTNVFDPLSLDLWDPFEGLFSPSSPASEASAFAAARVDWKETPEAHIFKADLPGIGGERSKEKEEKNDKWHRIERTSGKFLRRFRLPENAKIDEVKAGMENGVLTVTVPKIQAKKPEVKAIDISG
nr:17.8 kDa class I heat shock protein-like [Ipomoea batatas]